MNFFRAARLTCAALALTAAPAFSTVITYVDSTVWQAATAAGFAQITFDGLGAAPGMPANYGTSVGLVMGDGTTFVGVNAFGNNELKVYNENAGPTGYYNYGSGAVLAGAAIYQNQPAPYIHITFSAPVTSIGFDIMTGGGSGIQYNATLNGNLASVYTSGPTIGWTETNPKRAFFGFTSDSAISSINLSLPTSALYSFPIIDNFSYGTAGTASVPTDPSATPEMSTLLLIGSGLIVFAAFRRQLQANRPLHA